MGSGKTVLLNHILRNPGGRRICVIENEIGAISIDHSLLRKDNADSSLPSSSISPSSSSVTNNHHPGKDNSAPVLVLKNGCMCCSATGSGDELSRTLERLLSLTENPPSSSLSTLPPSSSGTSHDSSTKEKQSLPFDYVIIETSGMVDPAPLVQTFYRSSLNEEAQFTLDGIITVVDCKHILYHLQPSSTGPLASLLTNTKEAEQQIAYADLLLLNKVDTVTDIEKKSAKDIIQSINPLTNIRECSYGKVPVEELLNRSAFQVNQAVQNLLTQRLNEQQQINSLSLRKSTSKNTTRSSSTTVLARHTTGIEALTLSPPFSSVSLSSSSSTVPVTKLLEWLKTTVHQDWKNLYRIKGILRVHDNDEEDSTDDTSMHASSSSYYFAVHGVHAELQGSRIDLPTTSQPILHYPPNHSQHDHRHHHHGTECSDDCLPSVSTDDEFSTALVFIGKNLDKERYRNEFNKLYGMCRENHPDDDSVNRINTSVDTASTSTKRTTSSKPSSRAKSRSKEKKKL